MQKALTEYDEQLAIRCEKDDCHEELVDFAFLRQIFETGLTSFSTMLSKRQGRNT